MNNTDYFSNLSETDQRILQGLWFCPNDNTQLEKLLGTNTGDIEISRGYKKSDVAISNAIAMKKVPKENLEHSRMVSNLSFQIIPNDFIIFSNVTCPHCNYRGIAPKLPMLSFSNSQRNAELIQTLIEESNKAYKQQNTRSGGGMRRGGFFLWFILISILPLLVIIFFIVVMAIYMLFQVGFL
ncbi:MAG: hypothetical protein ACW981_15010 [Candidatus Hodarchaeales archaeon]|jgi:hypothetical protein